MLKSMIIAISTYSKIPMPRFEWKEKDMRYILCFFPIVGVLTGAVSLGAFWLMKKLGFGHVAIAGILTVLPIIINGGIHMDGFLDTVDAKSSYQSRERKLEILKDPHTGAFAIIFGIVYMLLYFSFCNEIGENEILFLAMGYPYSRILSGLSLALFQKAKKDGMAASFQDAASHRVQWILAAELVLYAAILLYLSLPYGIVILVAGAVSFGYYRWMAYREFGGVTGDLAGYFLQICELFILIVIVLLGGVQSWF